ncbi:hypothetical protein GCM10022254_23120 [Actinomadura meridiana]|uniref:Lipoprotein n=1 Tax=Actinomadura meridiana TaxID=559626 RepID=A0ABP8BXM3_9ACTN
MLAASLSLGVALSGCGVRPTGIIGAGALPSAAGSAPVISVYLISGPRLQVVSRPGLIGRPLLAIEQLAVPPTSLERKAGLHTDVRRPISGSLRGDGIAASGTRSALYVQPTDTRDPNVRWSELATAQIACTGEAIPGVERVRLSSETGWRDVTCPQFVDR